MKRIRKKRAPLMPVVEPVEKAIDPQQLYAKFNLLPKRTLMLFLGDLSGSI